MTENKKNSGIPTWEKFFRAIMLLVGITGGYQTAEYLLNNVLHYSSIEVKVAVVIACTGAIGLVFFYVLTPKIISGISKITGKVEVELQEIPSREIIAGVLGLIVGLIIANLLVYPLSFLPIVGPYVPIVLNIGFGYLGARIGIKRQEDIFSIFNSLPKIGSNSDRETKKLLKKGRGEASKKIVDTSAIIDGRILDMSRTGFLEGLLIIPRFVVQELQHIADSSDSSRRARGRRGLDVLNALSKENYVDVYIYEKDVHGDDVDSKLVVLAKKLSAKIITNDYNLNKVASIEGIEVLNINDLANALKPVALPGEEMYVHILKEGKEQGQGIAYLDDGTMIVVEGGRRFMNMDVAIVVTSVLQTSAGKMIFGRLKDEKRKRATG